MVGIYKYCNGLQFTGNIAKDETTAWAWLESTHGEAGKYYDYPVNRDCFKVLPIYNVTEEVNEMRVSFANSQNKNTP